MADQMIVSFSEVMKWDTCKRQYYYNFDLGLRPEEESEAIAKGVAGHRLLQSFYEGLKSGLSKMDAFLAVHKQAGKMLDDAKKNLNSKPLLVAWTLVTDYIKKTDFTSEAFLVENRFLIPARMLTDSLFFSDVQIGFTPDIVFKRSGGFMDVEDSKFIGRAWAESKLDHFIQAKLYQIFLNRMGYNVSRSGVRFFNVATGKVTSNFEPLIKDEEDSILEDFMGAVADVVEHRINKGSTRRTMNYSTCQYCSFSKPCAMDRKGLDTTKTLKYNYVKSSYDYTK